MIFNHPNVHREFVGYSETKELHIVAVYANPFRWQRRRESFKDFRYHMEHSPNVLLHVVELAFGDRPHEVTTAENPLDLQLRTDCVLWHKEALINRGVAEFPADWEYGGYVDGDFHFTRHDWALEAIHMLQHHSFVQLFSSYADLTGETATSFTGHRPYRMSASFAWNYLHPRQFVESRTRKAGLASASVMAARQSAGQDSYVRAEATRAAVSEPGQKAAVFPFGLAPGATGGAWAWRRDAFEATGGLLDTCILGSGDWHMAFGLVQATNVAAEMRRCTSGYIKSVLAWQERAKKLQAIEGRSPMGCIDNFATHAFHGNKAARAYGERWTVLQRHNFDPAADLMRDYQGIWRWAGNKPKLRDDVVSYFVARSEDGPLLLGEEPI